MMRYFLQLLILCLCFSCSNNKDSNQQEEEVLTIEKAKEIAQKYNLYEDTFDFDNTIPIQEKGMKSNNKNSKLVEGVNYVTPTVEEFELMVKDLAKYQQSKEGRAAQKMADFLKIRKQLTEKQIDSFYLAYDKEFDSNTFEMFRGKKEGVISSVIYYADDDNE